MLLSKVGQHYGDLCSQAHVTIVLTKHAHLILYMNPFESVEEHTMMATSVIVYCFSLIILFVYLSYCTKFVYKRINNMYVFLYNESNDEQSFNEIMRYELSVICYTLNVIEWLQ